jgi:S1-C subfamily serine protease
VSESKVEEMVQSRARRTYLRVTLLSAALIALLGWWGTNAMRTSSDEISASLEEASAAQRERDAQVADELRLARGVIERLQELNTLREEERIESERKRETLALALKSRVDERESAAVALSDRLGALEGDNEQGEEIQRLSRMIEETQAELREARTQLTSFNPVNLEQARLAGVSHVRRTVVLLEVEVALVNSETMELLYLSRDSEPNFDGRGIPVIMESSGSGFCVSEGGWILTNAHVADPHQGDLLALASELPIATQTSIYAVFSGTQERHHAELVKVADDDIDLALVRIDPFEGMPHLNDFNLESATPEPGGDLYLLGFPLGNFALQEGRTVIASTFRGILSRIVDGSLQVDAGVHPGNSGGPITDPLGRVIGIVTSVQATPEQTAVYTIGYGIPIADAASIWPPPAIQPAEDE